MLGDTAVAVPVNDPRYRHLVGKTVDLPLTDRKIPIIEDEHADPEKGTGCVKITPAHDPNDFEVGLRHSLDFINVFTKDAKMNERSGKYQGMDRFECRRQIVADMEALGLLIKSRILSTASAIRTRRSSRSSPMLSEQWFVKMTSCQPESKRPHGTIKFYPERWTKTYPLDGKYQRLLHQRQIWWDTAFPPGIIKNEIYVGVIRRKRTTGIRMKMFWTPGSAPGSGRSPSWAGRRIRRSSVISIRPMTS